MAYTSAIERAQCDMLRKLSGRRKPIIYINTNSIGDVYEICNHAFFHMEEGARDANMYTRGYASARYINFKDLVLNHNKSWMTEGAKKDNGTSTPYVYAKNILLYQPADGDFSQNQSMQSALSQYCELCRLAQNQYPDAGARPDSADKTPQAHWPQSLVVIYGWNVRLPEGLDENVDVVNVGRLTHEDIRMLLEDYLPPCVDPSVPRPALDESLVTFYHMHLFSFSTTYVRDILQEIAYGPEWANLLCSRTHAERIIKEKKSSLLLNHSLLEVVDVPEKISLDPGSFEKTWLEMRKDLIVRAENADPESLVKGMLFLGAPGTGKSRAAKAIADELGLPLLRLDMSRILGRYVGESDKNLRQALSDLSFLAPTVFWIDEIEKALGGGSRGPDAGGAGGDGLMDRLNSQLLTFQQEVKQSVFIVATANNIEKLLPEMFRNGRYSARIAKMLPSFRECAAIMRAKLKEQLGIDSDDLARFFVTVSSICEVTDEQPISEIMDEQNPGGRARPFPQFLTGADIVELVSSLRAHLKLRHGEHYKPLNGAEAPDKADWTTIKRAMCRAGSEVIATADTGSYSSIRRIAASYVAVFSESVRMGGRQPVLDKRYYDPRKILYYKFTEQTKNDKAPSCIECPHYDSLTAYDRALFDHISQEMNDYLMENKASAAVCADILAKRAYDAKKKLEAQKQN